MRDLIPGAVVSGYTDLLDERRRKRMRALAVTAVLVFAAAVWALTSDGGDESTQDSPETAPYERIGAWRDYDRLLDLTALFTLPDGCVLAVGEGTVRTLGPDEGLECPTPRDDRDLLASASDDAYRYLPSATRFGDGFALLMSARDQADDEHLLSVLTGSPGAWRQHRLTSAPDADAGAIAWDGEDLVVLGTDGEGPVVWRSSDGEKWREQRPPGAGSGLTDFRLASDGRGTTLAAATDEETLASRLWRSDGTAWTAVSPVEGTFRDLAHDGTAFHLVGSLLDAAGRRAVLVASSVEGLEWTVDRNFWRGTTAKLAAPLADGSLMVFTDGIRTDDDTCADVVHRETGDAWTGEPLRCTRSITDAIELPDGRVVAVGDGHVYVREAA